MQSEEGLADTGIGFFMSKGLHKPFIADLMLRFNNSEHGPVFNRATIGVLVSLYLISPWFTDKGDYAHLLLVIAILYISMAMLLLAWVFYSPGVSRARRIIGAIADIAAVTSVLYVTGAGAMPLVAVYLWVIIGYGFRYGLKYLIFTTLLSLGGFSFVLWQSGLWSGSISFSITMLIMLTLIPFYLGLLIQRLHRAMALVEDATRAKSRFLANMSHELRTPLNGVIGMGALLMDTSLDPKQKDLAHSIQTSADVLLGVIEKVLDFSRIEAGKTVIEQREFDLHTLVSDTTNIFSHQAKSKGLIFSSHIDPGAPYLLVGDVFHIQQVLNNLIGNAIKFTPEGRVDLRVLSVKVAEEEILLRFEVEDTGIGIAEKDQHKLFESFQQLDASTTRRFGGTGLGTAIARQLVELMGGSISLDSEQGKGTCFRVELPLKLQQQDIEDDVYAMKDTRALLLVSSEIRQTLSPFFRHWDLDIEAEETSVRAFARLISASEAGQPYSVVLLEQEALDVSAEHFLRSVLAEPELEKTSLVLLQGLNESNDTYYLELGYSSVLHGVPEQRLLFNALHAARAEHAVPDNVVSLAEYYERQLGGQARPLQILVAEDNLTNQQVLCGILEGVGHEVTVVANGVAAVNAIEQFREGFDLMLFDMNMPEMGGLEAMKVARFMEVGRHVPVIILTADATQAALDICEKEGADAYLTKPVEAHLLLETLARLACKGAGNKGLEKGGEGYIETHIEKASGFDGAESNAGLQEEILIDEKVLQGLLRLGSGVEFFEELVASFSHDAKLLVKKMRRAIVEHDYPALQDAAHALRGSASEFGAYRLVRQCMEIRQLRPFDMTTDTPAELLSDVQQTLKDSRHTLLEYVARYREAKY